MSQDISVVLKGFDEAQKLMLRAVRATEPKGALGQAVKEVSLLAQAYSAEESHVWTGTLKRSHVIEWDGGNRATVSPSAYNVNPRSKSTPSYYGPYEAARGGEHDFYGLAVARLRPQVGDIVSARIERYIES